MMFKKKKKKRQDTIKRAKYDSFVKNQTLFENIISDGISKPSL